jgi:hypothetical protein
VSVAHRVDGGYDVNSCRYHVVMIIVVVVVGVFDLGR